MLDSFGTKERKFWHCVFALTVFLTLCFNFYDSAFATFERVEGAIVSRERTYPLQSMLTGRSDWTVTVARVQPDESEDVVGVSPRLYYELKAGQMVRLDIRRGALSGRVLDSILTVSPSSATDTGPALRLGGYAYSEKDAEILRKDAEAMKARDAEIVREKEAFEKLMESLRVDYATNAKASLDKGAKGTSNSICQSSR